MKPRELKFEAHPDKGQVSALLLKPTKPKALIVLGHGAGAGMRHATMEAIANGLAVHKIATFRYQFPFMERGGGRDSLAVSISTVANAVKEARKTVRKIPLFAAGHSFGGRMTSLAAAGGELEMVNGVIYFGFPLHPSGKPSSDRATHLPEIKQEMLFVSGTRDKLLTPKLFKPVLKKLGKRANVHWLDTADHSYKILKRTRDSKEDIFDEITRVAAEWIEDRIP